MRTIPSLLSRIIFPVRALAGLLLLSFGLLYSPQGIQAQNINSWEATTSYNTINDMVQDRDGRFWIITEGGLFSWRPGGNAERFTPLDGMYQLRPSAIAYDEAGHQIWLGYNDGTLQRLNIDRFSWTSYNDIRRNSNFNSRGVNQLSVLDGFLYVATQFGIVEFEMASGLVRDSFVNLGSFNRGTPVQALAYANGRFYAATPSGLAAGDRSGNGLSVPGNWDTSNGSGSIGLFEENVVALGVREQMIYISDGSDNYSFDLMTPSAGWQQTDLFSGAVERFRSSSSGQTLLGISREEVTLLPDEGSSSSHQISNDRFLSAFYDDAASQSLLLLGTESGGLLVKNDLDESGEFFRLSGPDSNFFTEINIEGDELISASTTGPGQSGVQLRNTGYYIYRNNEWVSFNARNTPELSEKNFQRTYRSAVTEDHYFFGSFGRGMAMHEKATDDITIFDTENSPLPPFAQSNNGRFLIVSGLDTDSGGALWLTTYLSDGDNLYRYVPDTGEWSSYPDPSELANGIYTKLYIDSANQKWMSLENIGGSGIGLMVLRTNEDGTVDAARLTSSQNQGNLPDDLINDIVQDRRGEVWIATGRGVARFLFPTRIIDGSPQDRQASLLINADPDSDSPFLLRDVDATSIAVNAANQKWIGSRGDGLWLIDAEGRRVLRHFTTDNSPLFSDIIEDVAVDDATGIVYVATAQGLLTYTDVPASAERSMDDLFVYPNPYEYDRHSGNIIIEGLTEETLLSIVSVDGRMVNRVQARSGRAEWNGRDFNGNLLASGVYIIVANDQNGDERGIGKVAIIR
jgi:sugar lactone lactonase YvrE